MIRNERHGRVLLLTMEGENDLNLGVMGEELSAALDAYRDDDDLWCAVIIGAGTRAFSAGADVSQLAPKGFESNYWTPTRHTLLTDSEFPKPVVAAINGHAIGAGLMIALACDVRIASDNATFGLPEVRLGFPPALGATQRLARQIPLGPALEMLMTGRRISSAEAERWGLVNRVVPQSELLPAALEIARDIAANPPLAVRAARTLAYSAAEQTLAEGLRLEAAVAAHARDTDDAREALRARAEKREPQFRGK